MKIQALQQSKHARQEVEALRVAKHYHNQEETIPKRVEGESFVPLRRLLSLKEVEGEVNSSLLAGVSFIIGMDEKGSEYIEKVVQDYNRQACKTREDDGESQLTKCEPRAVANSSQLNWLQRGRCRSYPH